ncbi:amidohydrolase [Denitromonas iodatirespirans]|uniref:Amidohydrolase n=1 Tax=Denitromonas iodatirespirans TaxID=2795389 RepID=A0A944H9V8_DENI1|nr:amidohydrolase [Denitromonas iodatirespirans]MBT0963863.1 amidohydrolase [Denitromonas iodatirespirans]
MKKRESRTLRTRVVWCAAGLAATALVSPLAAQVPAKADLVVRNGPIYTMADEQSRVEAFAVRDGRYVFRGSNTEVMAYVGPDTQILDLHGTQMAMPGINDVHMHPLDGAYEDLYACNMAPNLPLPAVLARVADCVQRAEPGDWIVGAAWGSGLIPEVSTADALAALDKVSGAHPVVLRDDSFHNRWVNSEVMRRVGITAESISPPGSEIVKDAASGAPSGLLKEFPAFLAVMKQIPPRTPERQTQAAIAAGKTLNAFGITGAQDAFDSEAILKIWHQVDREHGLPFHMVASLSAMPPEHPGDRTGIDLVDVRDQYRSANVRPAFAKLFLDGVPPARTAKFLAPYLPDHQHGNNYSGEAKYTLEQLTDLLTALDKRGVPVKMHATGDGSVRLALDAIEAVRKRNGPDGPQHQIAHASFIAPDDIPRFAQLDVVADISPMLWFPSGIHMAIASVIGKARADLFFPVKSLVQAGALVAGGSDWPAGQPTANPWIGIEGLVTRKDPMGIFPGALWAKQAVDLPTALRIYTRNSAEAMGLGQETGSIEVGKSADFIVLDQDILQLPVEQIHTVMPQRTFFKGKQVHARPEGS